MVENATIGNFGRVQWLSWLGAGPGILTSQLFNIRIQNASCGGSCDAQDRYRVRLYETTYTVPRFNNSGTQSTVLLIQNATDRACAVTAFLVDREGVVVTALALTADPYQVLVMPTASAAPNASGSARVTHGCGYGGLSGKAVSIEPATGFAFDTPLLPRP